jgi:hypothetical protein
MGTKMRVAYSLVLVFLTGASGYAQIPYDPLKPFGDLPPISGPAEESVPAYDPSNLLPSNWIRYSQPDCCCLIGCDGPIKSELYIRSGLEFPMGGGDIPKRLNSNGWTIESGARVLFFNVPRTGAWDIDIGGSFISNAGDNPDPVFLDVFVKTPSGTVQKRAVDATIRHLYRTYGNLSGGYEWYFGKPANAPGYKLRAGFDVGGRWGTARLDFNELQHRTDNVWGVFTAFHSDLEYPCCSCVWFAGFRGEFGYSWMGILQAQNNSNIADMSVLFQFGVRF